MEYFNFWGASYASEDVGSAASRILEHGRNGRALPVRFVNANSIASAYEDKDYRSVIASAGINYPDGLPLAACLSLMSKISGGGKKAQVRGPSVFEETLRQSSKMTISHLFFGGNEETIRDLRTTLAVRYPNLAVTAYISPPMTDAHSLVSLAKEAHDRYGGDVIWLGLGAPKQDFVAYYLAEAVNRPCVGVGAAFDFLAGRMGIAPQWMQASGLEWLYRFIQEPRRLWRRYTVGNLRFVAVASNEVLRSLRRSL